MSAAIFDMTRLISRDEAAAILGIRPHTLACWASNGRYGLSYVRIGRRAMYRRQDIEAFITANLVIQEAA